VSPIQHSSRAIGRKQPRYGGCLASYAEAVGLLGVLGMAGGFAARLVWQWIGRGFARPS
jgi:hypothetical protein